MRINVYSQELILDESPELVTQESNTGITYSAIRIFLHSSEKLHHPPQDDDRSAITFWLPKSDSNREKLIDILGEMIEGIRQAPSGTGLD